jgi:hypothetical protein
MNQITRTEQDGIEFFTIAATGESGTSQSGLAILTGVNQSTISRLEKSLTTNTTSESPEPSLDKDETLMREAPSESLKPWMGKVLTLMCNDENLVVDGKPAGNLVIYRADFCAAVIQHYAFKGNKVAQHSLSKFTAMGINTWIQGITHWDSTPVDLQNIIATAQKFLGQYIQRQDATEQKVEQLAERVQQHESEVDRIFHPDGKFFSIRGWAKLHKVKVSKQEAIDMGRQATKLSKHLGVEIDKLQDPRYGEVNIYHETILEKVFESEDALPEPKPPTENRTLPAAKTTTTPQPA